MSRRRVLIDGGPVRGRRGLARYAKELAYQLSHAGAADVDIDILVPAEGAGTLAATVGPGVRLVPRPYRGFALWQADLCARARRGYQVFHGLDNGLPLGLPHRLAKVVTVHDTSFLDWRLQTTWRNRLGNSWRALRFRALPSARARVIAVSRGAAVGIEAAGVQVARIAPPSIAMMLATPPRRPVALAARPYLLIAGGASGYKRAGFAAKALGPLARSRGLDLVMFGLGAAAGVGEAQVLGGLDDAEVGFLYRHAQATVFPSIREGFGLPIVESLGFGTPVVAADLSPMTELRLPGAHFFRADEAADLRRAVAASLDEPRPTAGGPAAVAAFYARQPSVAELYGEAEHD